jgi:hypothetical protein
MNVNVNVSEKIMKLLNMKKTMKVNENTIIDVPINIQRKMTMKMDMKLNATLQVER